MQQRQDAFIADSKAARAENLAELRAVRDYLANAFSEQSHKSLEAAAAEHTSVRTDIAHLKAMLAQQRELLTANAQQQTTRDKTLEQVFAMVALLLEKQGARSDLLQNVSRVSIRCRHRVALESHLDSL